MSAQRDILVLVGVCGIVVLLSILGIVWAVATGLLYPHITMDGLLLVLVCLTLGGVFSLMLFFVLRQAGWLPRLPFLRKKQGPEPAPAAAPAGNPADPAAGKGK